VNVREFLKNNIVYLDGAMGTILQERGLGVGELPERWNVSHPDVIREIHKAYFDAGSYIVCTNTFGANVLKYSPDELESVGNAALENAFAAREESTSPQEKFVALDIGPLGRMLAPYGDLDFEEAIAVFSETVKLGARYGADLIFIETFSDSYETKAAVLAAKENSDLPVFVSNAYGEDSKLMTGASPAAMVALLEGLGADAIGANCSRGPKALEGVVCEYLKYSSLPVIFKPNAGLPRVENLKTVYDLSAEDFSLEVEELVKKGVRVVGGCCGTSPEYIAKTVKACTDIKVQTVEKKNITAVSSYTHAVVFGEKPILIGERINPTGKKRFKEALKSNDVNYILKEGLDQQSAGAEILDVNVGLPEIDERKMLTSVMSELQAVSDLPLQIDTSNGDAMEKALRRYNGKAMINSVNGTKESMDRVFPLAKKYGGLIVALTLDEKGIPALAEERLEIAKKILSEAESYGIDKKDIIFDPLALTISADQNAAKETLRAVKMIKEELGCHTSLGVSNVSFGLPNRDFINSTFFALAMQNGLSAAIMNPYSLEMMKAYRSYLALSGMDENCGDYITFAQSVSVETPTLTTVSSQTKDASSENTLRAAIIKGLRDSAASISRELLREKDGLDIVNGEIIPALDTVGEQYEKKTLYLPQLLMSAEAAKAAFEQIKAAMPSGKAATKCPFVIATVKGDIHDIGKNIVRLILENYAFDVCDLGRDVPPCEIVNKVLELNAPLVGLSALMTTTVPAMEETIKLLREKAPFCKILVGGAVLNEEYAKLVGADKYARDAMEALRYADEVFESVKK